VNAPARLWSFFRSGTSHRLRIALNLKGIDAEYLPIDLRTGQHTQAAYRAINPQGLVPSLEIAGAVMTQTPAILEWLEETHPQPPLLPADALARARVRALAAIVGCDIHPLNNRRVLEALKSRFGADQAAIDDWCGGWIREGFEAFEQMLAADPARGRYSYGDAVTLADVYLVPQVESARRFKVDLSRYPRIVAVDAACAALAAFRRAAPAAQPDAPPAGAAAG